MKIVGIIPARFAATRLPGKILKPIAGKPLIQYVYQGAGSSKLLDDLFVATDDRRIFDAVGGFGGKAIMTSPAHQSGSDRLAEAALGIDCGIVVNIQGDEPLIRGEMIDSAVEPLLSESDIHASTLATKFSEEDSVSSPNVVKVVTDRQGNALYFSRAPIPFHRDDGGGKGRNYLKHLGLYAYRKQFLLQFTKWPQAELEKAEKLEQLRILENGADIRVVITPYDSVGVDSEEDFGKVSRLLTGGQAARNYDCGAAK
jgi:3-deoxy-manno-octulosonate cytidylyltransferase (CMP-KDO synthetase)